SATAAHSWPPAPGRNASTSRASSAPAGTPPAPSATSAGSQRRATPTTPPAGARGPAHVFGPDALPGLIGAGIDCIEHGTGLTDDTIAVMVEHGTSLVPTLINIETFPDIAAAGASKVPRYADQRRELHAGVRPTVRNAIEAGIPVYAGTDAGGGIAHGRIVDEIIALHEAGMTTEQALGAASWTARGWLGWSGIRESSAADIVAYAEDPRADLNALRHPTRMSLRGRVIH